MKISLRKADAIQHEIKAAMRDLSIRTRITITEYENPETVIDIARERSEKNLLEWTSLNSVLYTIRKQVDQANKSSGISDILADIAAIDARISVLREMTLENAQATDLEILKGQLKKIRDTPRDGSSHRYGGLSDEIVQTGIFTAEEIEAHKAEVQSSKKKIMKFKDDLLRLNLSTEIELSKIKMAILERAGIV